MTPEQYADWLAVARRYSRVPPEAEDLLHDALLAAAAADRLDLTDEANRRWLTGVIRNQAAFRARTATRQRRREQAVASGAEIAVSEPLATDQDAVGLGSLPPSARSVAALALHGLGREEICAVLGLSATAFRQRLVTLRRGLGRLPDDLRREALALAYARRQRRADDLALGLIRRALLAQVRGASGVGTHDPDGHLFVIA
ncbi:MAG: sigma factor [Bacteroidota bacterium]